MEQVIKGKMWFVNGKRLGQRYSHSYIRSDYPVEGTIRDEEISAGGLVEKYKTLELVGDTEMELNQWDAVTIKAVDAGNGDVTEYQGKLIEYHHGWDGMDGTVTTIKIILDKEAE